MWVVSAGGRCRFAVGGADGAVRAGARPGERRVDLAPPVLRAGEARAAPSAEVADQPSAEHWPLDFPLTLFAWPLSTGGGLFPEQDSDPPIVLPETTDGPVSLVSDTEPLIFDPDSDAAFGLSGQRLPPIVRHPGGRDRDHRCPGFQRAAVRA